MNAIVVTIWMRERWQLFAELWSVVRILDKRFGTNCGQDSILLIRPRPPGPHQPGKGDADHGPTAAGPGDSGGDFVPAAGSCGEGFDDRKGIAKDCC